MPALRSAAACHPPHPTIARVVVTTSLVALALGACARSTATQPPAGAPAASAPAATPPASATVDARRKAFDELLKEQWEDNLARHPIFATLIGDKRYNDKVDDFSLAAIQDELAAKRRFRDRFAAIDTAGFGDQERLNRELMLWSLDRDLEEARFKDWEMPVNQVSGIQIMVPQLVMIVPLQSVKDYEDYIARLKQVPRVFQQAEDNMRQGVADGLVPPRILLEKAVTQTEAIAKQPAAETPFVAAALAKLPKDIAPADRDRLKAQLAGAVTESVLPAYQRLARFLRTDYLQHGRAEPGVWALPDGAERYAFDVRRSTTTGLTPDQIHETGLAEVARIEHDMLAIAERLGYHDLRKFETAVRDDPKLKARSGQQILDLYTKYIDGMKPELPHLFGRLPKADMKVIAVEPFRAKEAPDAEYMLGTPDGSRPGYVQVNTYDPQKRSVVEIEATAYHEGLPGHHMQLSIQQELPELPLFRKFGFFGNAFVEGWALYAERLGKDVGFYEDPYSDYGRLESEMLRAIRLVVDTGFHAKHWTRDQVVKFFHDHSAIDEISVQNETDRYIAWPAQALSYKVGQLRILDLRARAEKELGPKFDIKAFHDQVLGGGSLPLDVLDRRIEAWIADTKG